MSSFKRRLRSAAGTGIALLALAGCAWRGGAGSTEQYGAAWPDIDAGAERRTAGAIYSEGRDIPLWENATARRVGDILTVRLAERTNATKSSSTNTSKASESTLSGPTIAGRPVTANGVPILEGALANDSTFTGAGDSRQSNRMDGDITVTVVQRLRNGNLLVRGQKWISINQGREFVRLQGIVRPEDVAPDNSVQSWRVADARIDYGGTGQLANANAPGLFHRFFNSPLLPF